MKNRYLYLATLSVLLAACNSMPANRNSQLDQATEHFKSAQADSQVSALAPEELARAGESLRIAELAWMNGDKTDKVDHLAYMADRRVVIAQETASSKTAQNVTASAAAERDKMRLEMRTAEADIAHQQLAIAKLDTLQKEGELSDVKDAAARNAENLERSDARVNDLEYQLKDLNARKTSRGMVVTLGDVLFDTGKSTLVQNSSHNIDKLVGFFIRNPQRKATIEGYTDNIGSTNSNYRLSEKRANAVMKMLVDKGVPPDRLSTHAYGEESPIADNGSAAGRQMNRRVEIVFAQQSGEVSKK